MYKCLWLVLVCLMLGCTGGFNREMMMTRITGEQLQVTDDEVRKAKELKPQLLFPCRVAVSLQGEGGDWRWTPKDKELLDASLQRMRHEGIVSDAFLMSDLFVSGTSVKELRLAAANHGADALLVVKGLSRVEGHSNPAAVFNLTVVGGFVIPSSHRDARFTMQGGLIDVSNGYLYASMESEGEGGIVRPAFIVEDKDAVTAAKKQAVERFVPELHRRMQALRASFAQSPPPPPPMSAKLGVQ